MRRGSQFYARQIPNVEAYQGALQKEWEDTPLCNDPKQWVGK
ncbi:MAG: hypothetical protein ACK421_03975 [Pseudanabaenaceae cyanobacterium]